MYIHLVWCILRCDWSILLVELTKHGVSYNLQYILLAKTNDVRNCKTPNHRGMEPSGDKNGARPREGPVSWPAKREGQGKAATE